MTFKVTEVKDGLVYQFVTSDFAYSLPNERVFKNNNAYDCTGKIHADDTKNIYEKCTFTLKYPDSIEEAAKHLDAHYPGWADKIDLDNFHQITVTKCVLGQLYGGWALGMKALYNLNVMCGIGYGSDSIFGTMATGWEKEIMIRKQKFITFGEAIQQAVFHNKKIAHKNEPSDIFYLDSNLGLIWKRTKQKVQFHFNPVYEDGWFVLPDKIRFKDLTAGQKFVLAGKAATLIKAKKDGFAISNNDFLEITQVDSEAIVELRNE